MRWLPLLSLLLALGLGGCGDESCDSGGEQGEASTAEVAALAPRDAPLAVGDEAPTFDGLPAGPVVVVFYRGHW